MNVRYQKASEEDVDYLIGLRERTMAAHMSNSGVDPSEEEQRKRVLYKLEKAKIIYVGSQRAGLLKTEDNENFIELIQIQLEPEYQGKGIGKAIIDELIHDAKKKQKSVKLSVLKKNPAKRLYLKLGFKIVGEDPHEYFMLLR